MSVSDISELRLQEHWDMLDVTSGDASSWYMISGDAKSWVCLLIFTVILHNCPLCVLLKLNGWFWRLKMCTLRDLGFKTEHSCVSAADEVMSTSAYVDSETITLADGAQSSRVPVPLPDDPYVAVEELQSLGFRVPLTNEEFEAFKLSSTRTDSSASSDSTTPLSPDYPLTQVSPTPTPTRASFHHLAFRKRYRSSYETPSPSPSPTLPVWKRYKGTSELILDTNSEGDELGDEDTDEDGEDESSDADDERERLDDEGHGLDDEGHGLDDDGHGLVSHPVNFRAPRNQGNRNRDAPRRIVPVETPTNALVVQDGIVVCPFCENEEEDIEHCLIRCPHVLPIWRKVWSWWHLPSYITFPSFSITYISLGKLVTHDSPRLKKAIHGVFQSALWAVWKWRNKLINSPPEAINTIKEEDIFLSIQRLTKTWISARYSRPTSWNY
ncbi:hypothetical protein Tco_0214448 [Tanacetum coccineum]